MNNIVDMQVHRYDATAHTIIFILSWAEQCAEVFVSCLSKV